MSFGSVVVFFGSAVVFFSSAVVSCGVLWYPAVVLWCGDGAVAMALLSCSVAVPW